MVRPTRVGPKTFSISTWFEPRLGPVLFKRSIAANLELTISDERVAGSSTRKWPLPRISRDTKSGTVVLQANDRQVTFAKTFVSLFCSFVELLECPSRFSCNAEDNAGRRRAVAGGALLFP